MRNDSVPTFLFVLIAFAFFTHEDYVTSTIKHVGASIYCNVMPRIWQNYVSMYMYIVIHMYIKYMELIKFLKFLTTKKINHEKFDCIYISLRKIFGACISKQHLLDINLYSSSCAKRNSILWDRSFLRAK